MSNNETPDWLDWRDKIIGLGEQSAKKSYYPELQKKVKQLEETQNNIYNAFENISDGIIILDKNCKIIEINKATKEILHITHLNLKSFAFFKYFSLDKTDVELETLWNEILKSDIHLFEWELKQSVLRTDEKRIIEISFRKTIWSGELAIISVIRDITEKKLSEAELIKAREKAEESDRLKSSFLANMSHEIRTPMNGILGFAQFLKDNQLSQEEYINYINIIEKSGQRMLNIINDIVDISKIEAGQMTIIYNNTDLNELVDFVYNFFKPETSLKNIKLLLNKPKDNSNYKICTDKEKLYAILINLVKNAIKYTSKGFIEFGYEVKETFVEFYVKDSGLGIAEDKKEMIFERFIQVDMEDRQAFQGAGLGLSISKAYVEMLGGNIWVKSKENEGSTFYFTIKADEKLIAESKNQINESKTVNKNKLNLKILIAEDDEISEILVEKSVKRIGQQLYKARTGLEAVETLKNNPDIDLILMDIKMPGINGYEATRQIREFNKDVIIIAQTAFGLNGDIDKAIESGCNDYISKPINTEKLLTLIKTYF